MSTQQPKKKSTFEFLLTFAVLFLTINLGLKFLFPDQFGGDKSERPAIELTAGKVRSGHHPILTIRNNMEKDLTLPERCPQPPVDIAFITQQPSGSEKAEDVMANETVLPCALPTVVPAGKKITLSLAPWKYSLFSTLGTYRATLDLSLTNADTSLTNPSVEFRIVEVGGITKLFRTFVTRPFLNGLIFIASFLPDHNLGIAIILLTLVIKLSLLIPNQHALEGQKKLQDLQPKLDEVKKKYKGDAKKQQEATLKLWQENKINPMQSCLPMLLQFPILIGLFYVIRDGAVLEISRHLVYSFYQDLPWSFGTNFLGLDLTRPSVYIMPPFLVVMQFIQMKMAFARKKDKKIVDVNKKWWPPEMNQQTVMLYALPLMIGFFAIRFPAAVSLYWAVSTVFAIGQQWFVNRKASSG